MRAGKRIMEAAKRVSWKSAVHNQGDQMSLWNRIPKTSTFCRPTFYRPTFCWHFVAQHFVTWHFVDICWHFVNILSTFCRLKFCRLTFCWSTFCRSIFVVRLFVVRLFVVQHFGFRQNFVEPFYVFDDVEIRVWNLSETNFDPSKVTHET
jgi:hypothetical protein